MSAVYVLTFDDAPETSDLKKIERVTESQHAALFAFKCLIDRGLVATLSVKGAKHWGDVSLDDVKG